MPKYKTKLIKKEPVAEGTMAFHLEKPEGFEFKPGQNMDIELLNHPETDKEGNKRTFSIVSSPSESELIFTTRLRDTAWKRVAKNLPEGTEVEIDGPYGNMILHSDILKPAVFLAGGIGITPFMSMIRYATENNLEHKIFLFYSNRRPVDAPFMDELLRHEDENPNFKLVATMTETPEWTGEKGYITLEMIKRHLPDAMNAIFYLAGPPRMVESMKKVLENSGVSDDYIKREDFTGY